MDVNDSCSTDICSKYILGVFVSLQDNVG